MKRVLRRLLPGGNSPVVAAVRLQGVIGRGPGARGLTLAGVAKTLEAAFSLGGVRAVALLINSPGGAPVQSALITTRIRALAAEKELPVVAFLEDVAASGGYMLACAGDEIIAHEASVVGSIGVVSGGFGFHGAIDKLGIDRRVYTAGKNKVRLDAFKPEKAEDVEWLKAIQGEIHDYFITLVKDRRGGRLADAGDDVFSGEVYLGPKAREIGLIDGLGDVRTVMRERYGDKVKIKLIQPKTRPLAALTGGDQGGAGIGLDAGDLLSTLEERALWSRYGL